MKFPLVIVLASLCLVGCDLEITTPSPVITTPPSSGGAITITNTNTNTATQDRSDTEPTPTPSAGGNNGTTGPLPLPTYGESVTRDIAAANPALLANSCQETSGESAWQFLDLVIRTLRAQDQRWGYLCKDAACLTFARDVVAYRASSGDTGIWIVDIIGGHCPGPTDPPPAVRWGVLPFETLRKWAAARKAGIFP
jgi:hypothetical protein